MEVALTKLQFSPGIVRESTEYSASGGWYDADKVRFRAGHPEKMGGWQAVTETPMEGVCRYIHQWSTLEQNRYVGLGTNSHLYILWSENYYDLTPIGATFVLPADPFSSGPAGSNATTVTFASAHGLNAGDYVIFSGASTACDNYTPAVLNREYVVASVPDGTHITIPMADPAAIGNQAGGGPNVQATCLIPSGQPDAVIGMGWGIPPWGGPAPYNVGWGMPFDPTLLNPADPSVNQLRLWDIDNFGEDMVANVRGGKIYYWHQASGLGHRAEPLNQTVTVGADTFTPVEVPTIASQVLVSPNDRHLIAMGCNHPEVGITKPDLLLVRWSTEEDAYTWNPLRTNSAGDYRLSAGSYIIGGMRTRQEILIWTDLGLWSMKYIGAPYVFGFDSIAEGLSLIGPNAVINAGNAVFWMDRGLFYAYTGQTQELPCSLKDYVFGDLNFLQGYKVYAGHNHAFGEVVWFYPSANSLENDKYVLYNYIDQVWSKGTIERTAWLDMGRASYPVASDRGPSLLYYHEFGTDANGAPLPAWIESADLDSDGGEHYLFISRLIPDVQFRGSAAAEDQSVGLSILGRGDTQAPKQVLSRVNVTPNTGLETIRARERQISVRLESTAAGVSWRWGTMRTDMRPDGRK